MQVKIVALGSAFKTASTVHVVYMNVNIDIYQQSSMFMIYFQLKNALKNTTPKVIMTTTTCNINAKLLTTSAAFFHSASLIASFSRSSTTLPMALSATNKSVDISVLSCNFLLLWFLPKSYFNNMVKKF